MNASHSVPADGRLGVWRLRQPMAEVSSGHWWEAENALGRQPARVLVYREGADAGAVLLRMSQSPGQPWQHPAVAWPLDAGLTADGRPYVVMPAQAGEPLQAALPQASLRRRVRWLRQLAELMVQAQAQGLALVELDPSLLWLDPDQGLQLQALALVRPETQYQGLGALQGSMTLAAQPLQGPGVPGTEPVLVETLIRWLCLLVNGRLPGDVQPPAAPVALLSQWLSLSAIERSQLDGLVSDLLDASQRPASLDALAATLDEWLQGEAGATTTQPTPLNPLLLPAAGALNAAPWLGVAEDASVAPPPAFAPAWQGPAAPLRVPRRLLRLGLLGLGLAAAVAVALAVGWYWGN